jgi:hypothetical protein
MQASFWRGLGLRFKRQFERSVKQKRKKKRKKPDELYAETILSGLVKRPVNLAGPARSINNT